MEAFVDVRATRRFADCVQIFRAQFTLQSIERFEMRRASASPDGKSRARAAFELDELRHGYCLVTKALAKPRALSLALASATSAV